MKMHILSSLASMATVAGNMLYFVENTKIVPGDTNLWQFDTTTSTAKKLTAIDTSGTVDVVSGAVVCGNTFVS